MSRSEEPAWTSVALEEYRSLRQESLEAINRQHQTLALGTATSGVLVGIGVRAAPGGTVAVTLLMVLTPLLAAMVVALWIGEFQRMVRAPSSGGCLIWTQIRRPGASCTVWNPTSEPSERTEARAPTIGVKILRSLGQTASQRAAGLGPSLSSRPVPPTRRPSRRCGHMISRCFASRRPPTTRCATRLAARSRPQRPSQSGDAPLSNQA